MSIDEFYGNDKLFTLKEASDPALMSRILREALRHRLGEQVKDFCVEIQILRRRKQRCVLRYTLNYRREGRSIRQPIIGKVFKADHGEPVRDLMEDLWRHGFDRNADDSICVPEVIGYLPRFSLLLQEEIGGIAVKEHLNTPSEEQAIRSMARGLAKLHETPIRVGQPYTMRDHLRRCHPRAEVLHERCPELRPAVDEILSEVRRYEELFQHVETCLIHGDFHMGQVHVQDHQTWLIDFDACAVADPAADLGNVMVFLRSKERKVPNAHALADAFLDEYFQHRPSEIQKRVPLYEAITHLRRACKRLRFGKDGWHTKAQRFLESSLQSLSSARG